MKKVFGIILTAAAAASLIAASVGIYEYNRNKDDIKGCFFRKMYGSIGVVGGDECIVNMNMFCFGSDIEFLKDTASVSFDNPDVSIKSVDITEQDKEGDLTVYNLNFRLSVSKEGQSDISALTYKNGEESDVYELGKLSFVKKSGDNIFLMHSCNAFFYHDSTVISFNSANEEPFTVTDLIYADSELFKISYDKNQSFTPGSDLDFMIEAETSIDDKDIFIFQPVFEIRPENENSYCYFTPNMPVCNAEDLTFLDIREYVK